MTGGLRTKAPGPCLGPTVLDEAIRLNERPLVQLSGRKRELLDRFTVEHAAWRASLHSENVSAGSSCRGRLAPLERRQAPGSVEGSVATVYQATVQAPLNADGTSNWPAKSKGGIPVMFKLSSDTGAAAFESICSDNTDPSHCTGGNTANDYAYRSFAPTGLTFGDITTLKTDYTFTLGNCHGGSLRWSINTGPGQSLFIYYGDEPNTTDCTTNSQSGTNMIGLSDLRYDTSQYASGNFYDTYANALTLMGSLPVRYAALVLDSGWGADQRATISNTTVNDSVYQWNAGGTGIFAPTCALPDANLVIAQVSGSATGVVNETTVQQNFDHGTLFRVVDCKYQYVLSIPSLTGGSGHYEADIQIGGTTVGTAFFDLK